MPLIEYNGDMIDPSRITETFTIKASAQGSTVSLTESEGTSEYLLPRIEAIHAGTTRNFNHYLAEALRGDPVKKTGVYSWTQPYAKPVIYNHDTWTKATGRIMSAAYTDYTQAGRPGIILIPKITDPEAVQALKDGRLLTVSVGATAESVICSISGQDILKDGPSGYIKGEVYDGRTCEWLINDIKFDELSWVNVPADSDAMVTDTQTSVFLDAPVESEGTADKQAELFSLATLSANRSLQELFGVPKGVALTVPDLQEETDSIYTAENLEQEEREGMAIAEQEEKQEKEPEVIPAEKDDAVVDTGEKDPTPADPNPGIDPNGAPDTDDVLDPADDNPDDLEVKKDPELEQEENPKASEKETKDSEQQESDESTGVTLTFTKEGLIASEAKESVTQLVEMQTAGLRAQIEELTSELKSTYVERIVSHMKLTGDKKTAYQERLEKRTLDSLRDRLLDLQESFDVDNSSEKENVTRQATPAASPVPATNESVVESQTDSESARIQSMVNRFKKNW